LLYEEGMGCGMLGTGERADRACACARANDTPGDVSPIFPGPLAGNVEGAASRASKELFVGRGPVQRRSLRLRMARWRMKKTNAPRMSMTQAMVMPTMAPVGRPFCVLTAATLGLLAAPAVAELLGGMAEADAEGVLIEVMTWVTVVGGEGATLAVGRVVSEVVISTLVSVSVGRAGVVEVVLVVLVVGLLTIIWVKVVPVKPPPLTCLASAGASSQP